MTVNPPYKYVEKFAGGMNWYLMERKDFVSIKNFELKNESDELLLDNEQSIIFRLSIREV